MSIILGNQEITKGTLRIIGGRLRIAGPTLISEDLNDNTGATSPSNVTKPSGWDMSKTSGWTVYGATTTDSVSNTNRAWCFEHGQTSSGNTGPGGGMANGIGTTDGAWHNGGSSGNSDYRYMVLETSYPTGASGAVKRHLVRTAAINFTEYGTLTLHFWFNFYGVNTGKFGIAVTTSLTSASSANEAGPGLGFTSDDAGGATISYDSNGDGTLDASGVRISGQQQSAGNSAGAAQGSTNKWRKATANITNARGYSTAYIHFLGTTVATSQYYKGDMAIDNISIIGTAT